MDKSEEAVPPEEALALLEDGAYSVSAAMDFTGLGRSHLYQDMKAGKLRFLKHGKRRLIPKRELVEYLARNLVDRSEEPPEKPAR
jgi:excisionase family DNA binding protein